MKKLIVCALVVWLLTGCTPNPLGMTTRTQIRADAYVQVEQAKALADQHAREAEAAAIVNAEVARQDGLKQRTVTVMALAPFVVLAIGIVGGVWLYIHWRGKIAFEQVHQQAFGLPNTPPTLPEAWQQALQQRGWSAVWHDGRWYPVIHGQRIDKPINTRMLEMK